MVDGVAGSRLDASGKARACDKITLFLSRPVEIGPRAPGPVRGTAIARRGLALLEPLASRFFFTLRLPQASSTQSRRRRPIITGRCPQAAPDAPRATRAAAARSSTHRCTSPHPALQRRDSCRRRSNSARRTRRSPSPRLLTAPPPPATKQTQTKQTPPQPCLRPTTAQ